MAVIQTTRSYQNFGHALGLVMPKIDRVCWGLKPNRPEILPFGSDGEKTRIKLRC
jgi:hypothetical protein